MPLPSALVDNIVPSIGIFPETFCHWLMSYFRVYRSDWPRAPPYIHELKACFGQVGGKVLYAHALRRTIV